MRWTSAIPPISLIASILVTLAVIAPPVSAGRHLMVGNAVEVVRAAEDLRPQRLVEGEPVRTLRSAGAFGDPAAREYVAHLDLDAAPKGRIGVLVLPVPAKARAFINGLRVRDESTSRRGDVLIGEIPREGLQAGLNRVQTVAQAGPYRWPRAIFLGPVDPLRAAAARIVWMERWAAVVTGLLGSAGALIGFLLVAAKAERRPLIAPSLLALAFAAMAALAWIETPSTTLLPWVMARLGLGAVSALLLLLMAGSETDHWASWSTTGLRLCAVATGAVAAAGPLSMLAPGAGAALAHWSASLAALTGAGGSLVLILAGKGVREAWTPARRAIIALAALALLAAAIARHPVLGSWGYLLGQSLWLVSATLFSAGWLCWVGIRAFLDSEATLQQRIGLAGIVREQQAKIDAQQAALELEIRRRAVLEERERLSRDIHDGVGGSLASLLLLARTGDLTDDSLEAGLERSLEDLRLMVDALDHAPGALGVAFSTLQTRIAPTFRAAGIALDWRQENLEGRALTDSQSLLQVFRILQEATTNVIRHAGAASAQVRIGWDEAGNALVAEVEDDGRGGEVSESNPGKGLKNMAARADRIGAKLTVGAIENGQGWRVRLAVAGS